MKWKDGGGDRVYDCCTLHVSVPFVQPLGMLIYRWTKGPKGKSASYLATCPSWAACLFWT